MGLGKKEHLNQSYTLPVFQLSLLLALVISCFLISKYFQLSNYFPIKFIRVYGVEKTDQNEIKSALTPFATHGFFSINVDNIRDRLTQFPWVSQVFVRLYWPNRIEIRVIERNALAVWNDKSLLSEKGDVFSPTEDTYPKNLPKFNGPYGKQMDMVRFYNNMNRIFSPLHVKITTLEMTPYFDWKLKLNNGISIDVGHKDILTRLHHFVKVYAKIVGNRAEAVDTIDLRYPNGLAVRWKTPIRS